MSIEEQVSKPDTSTQAMRDPQLTAANLAANNRNTSTMTTNQAVRSWLDNTGTASRRYVDGETWMRLVEGDPVAADIEAALRGGNQNRAGQR